MPQGGYEGWRFQQKCGRGQGFDLGGTRGKDTASSCSEFTLFPDLSRTALGTPTLPLAYAGWLGRENCLSVGVQIPGQLPWMAPSQLVWYVPRGPWGKESRKTEPGKDRSTGLIPAFDFLSLWNPHDACPATTVLRETVMKVNSEPGDTAQCVASAASVACTKPCV